MGRLKIWFRPLRNNRGEGSISTGVKVIIAVVIGALILGGLYLLFAGDNGILSKVSGEVEDMMGYTQELRVEKRLDEATGKYKVKYSYDGKRWQDADMPDYGETATVEKIVSNNAESGRIDAMLISDGDKKVILTSWRYPLGRTDCVYRNLHYALLLRHVCRSAEYLRLVSGRALRLPLQKRQLLYHDK